uniref:Uncharacterized protein n=2 Tax=Clytia hemisphaerica TaxID=252671 RepID=A0A7M5U0S7_9CNID
NGWSNEDLLNFTRDDLNEILPGPHNLLLRKNVLKTIQGFQNSNKTPPPTHNEQSPITPNGQLSPNELSPPLAVPLAFPQSRPKPFYSTTQHQPPAKRLIMESINVSSFQLYSDAEIAFYEGSKKPNMPDKLMYRLVQGTVANMITLCHQLEHQRYPLMSELEKMAEKLCEIYPCLLVAKSYESLYQSLKRRVQNVRPTRKPQGKKPKRSKFYRQSLLLGNENEAHTLGTETETETETTIVADLQPPAQSLESDTATVPLPVRPTPFSFHQSVNGNTYTNLLSSPSLSLPSFSHSAHSNFTIAGITGQNSSNEPAISEDPCYVRNLKGITSELAKRNPDVKTISMYMDLSYDQRRKEFKSLKLMERIGLLKNKFSVFQSYPQEVIHEVRRTVDRESENFAQDAVEKFGKFIESAVYFATSKLKDFVCSIMLPVQIKLLFLIPVMPTLFDNAKVKKKNPIIIIVEVNENVEKAKSKRANDDSPGLMIDKNTKRAVVLLGRNIFCIHEHILEGFLIFVGLFYVLDQEYPTELTVALSLIHHYSFGDVRVTESAVERFGIVKKKLDPFNAEI